MVDGVKGFRIIDENASDIRGWVIVCVIMSYLWVMSSLKVHQARKRECTHPGGKYVNWESPMLCKTRIFSGNNAVYWIINFLSGWTQAVSSCGQTSGCLPVSQSIIQGSSIGPYLYLVYESDLQTLLPYNVIIKYADDTTLLVCQHSSVDIQQDYDNICSWSARYWLTINSDKTKEIVSHQPASRHLEASFVRHWMSYTGYSTWIWYHLHPFYFLDRMLKQINQRLYLCHS